MKSASDLAQDKNKVLNSKRTQAQWRTLIDEWETSGLTQKAFCQQQNLSYHNFVYHRKQYPQKPRCRKMLAPVKIVSKEKKGGNEITNTSAFQLKLETGVTFIDPAKL